MYKILCQFLLVKLRPFVEKIQGFIITLILAGFGVRIFKRIFTYTSQGELYQLFLLACSQRPGCRILEIGAHFGASSVYLAAGAALRNGRVYSVDTWMNDAMGNDPMKNTWEEFSRNTKFVSGNLTPIRARSTAFDHNLIDGPLDLVFIDGDHSYQGVKGDFEYILPILKGDGLIAFHDVSNRKDVAFFLGELLQTGCWRICGQRESIVWITRANL